MQVSDVVASAAKALAGKPSIGGTICVDFGASGVAYVYADNRVAQIPQVAAADCTVRLSLETLAKLESGKESVIGAVLWGDLKISGDRGLAERFGSLAKGAST